MSKSLYERDIVLWATEQARALREAGVAQLNVPAPIDWDNVAEEIESLGRSERSALRSRLAVIIEHLMKLQVSPAEPPRNDWMDSIDLQRREIEYLLEDSPSLRREVGNMIGKETPRARRTVLRTLTRHGEQPATDLNQLSHTEEQVLGDWFPPRA
jgi:Domain of unknown function DUF29